MLFASITVSPLELPLTLVLAVDNNGFVLNWLLDGIAFESVVWICFEGSIGCLRIDSDGSLEWFR